MSSSAIPARTPTGRRVLVRHGWTIGVAILLAILLFVEADAAPAFSSFDFQSLVIAALPLAFAAMAQAVVVISRGIDLSVGAVMALTNVTAAQLMVDQTSLGPALAISALVLVIGLVIGTINGLAV